MKTVMDKVDLVEMRRAIDDFQDFADVAVGKFPCHVQDRGVPRAGADLRQAGHAQANAIGALTVVKLSSRVGWASKTRKVTSQPAMQGVIVRRT